MEVTLTAVKRTPRIAKASGKPFVSLGIRTEQHGDKWLSGFGSSENENWDVGQKVQIEVQTKGDYLNFTIPKEQKQTTSSGPETSPSEIKNIFTFKILPLLEQNNAGIQQMLHALGAIADRLEYHLGKPDTVTPDDVPF